MRKKSGFARKIHTSRFSPLNWLEREEKRTIYEARTGNIKIIMSRDEALVITIMALISAFITVYVRFAYILRFSLFESNAVMVTWHPYGAPWKLIGITLFIVCCWRKGVDYWLVYFGAFTGLIYFIVEGLLVHNIVDVHVLADFFTSIGWYPYPEWLVGYGV